MQIATAFVSHFWAAYYAAYLSICVALILWLGRIFRRAGAVFLSDAFAGNAAVIRAVSQLLDLGFYLISLGYVGSSFRDYDQLTGYGQVAQIVGEKVGGFLLLMGFTHLFNLLVLALFRRRGAAANPAAANGAAGA
jgi:hypothetical protein